MLKFEILYCDLVKKLIYTQSEFLLTRYEVKSS